MNVVYYTPIPVWQRLKPVVESMCQNSIKGQWFRPIRNINCGLYSEMDRSIYERREKKTLFLLQIIDKSYPNFHVLPIHEFLCNSYKCPSHINAIRLYRDNTRHISILGAKKYLSREIRSFLLQRKLIEKTKPG